jgi:imidazolonepropionase-like amidohydrolase
MRSLPFLLLSLAAFSQSPASETIVFRNVRVFDGERLIQRTTVVIDGGKIAAVAPGAAPRPGATIIDGAGKTLLPGFIDAHTHTIDSLGLRQAAVFGVTTTLDMFTDQRLAASIKKQQSEGKLPDHADLRSAGTLATSPHGHGTEYGLAIPTLSKPGDAEEWVDGRIAEGSDYIKIVFDDLHAYGRKGETISKETLKAIIDAVHKRRRMAVVHISALDEAEEAIRDGADGLVHLFVGDKTDPEFGKLAAAHHAFVIPTLSVICGAGFNSGIASDADLKAYLGPNEAANLKRTFPVRMQCKGTFEALRQLRDAHVPILAGSDTPNPGTTQGATVHGEMELMVREGLTPVQALIAATASPAKVFHLDDRGVIATGKRADLVLVEGDPATDIKATRHIAGVWKQGIGIDRSAWKSRVEVLEADEARRKNNPPPAGSESGKVSDFEGETLQAAFGSWLPSLDTIMGGKSTGTIGVVSGGAQNSKGSLKVSGEVKTGFSFPWSGAMFNPGQASMAPVNLSGKRAITFWAKGDGKTYRLMMFAQQLGMQPAVQTFVAGPEWKQYRFPLSEFGGIDGNGLMGIVWAAGPSLGPYEFQLDDVRFEQ